MSENQNTAPAKVELTVSGVLADLANGLTRNHIQAKYELSGKDMRDLFSHPKLKGKKTTPAPGFILIDDTEDEAVADTVADTVGEVALGTQEVSEPQGEADSPFTGEEEGTPVLQQGDEF